MPEDERRRGCRRWALGALGLAVLCALTLGVGGLLAPSAQAAPSEFVELEESPVPLA